MNGHDTRDIAPADVIWCKMYGGHGPDDESFLHGAPTPNPV